MNTSATGKINVADVFRWTLGAALAGIKNAVIQKGSEIPAVQRGINEQKISAGKNILWKYFPFVILAGMGIFMLSKVK